MGSAWDPDEDAGGDREAPPTEQLLPPVSCPACGASNRGSRVQCERCGEPLRPQAVRTVEQRRQRPPLVPTPLLALIALAIVAAGAWFLFFAGDGDDSQVTAEASASADGGGAQAEEPAEPEVRTYVVAEGDSLSSIAQEFGTTVEAIVAENGIENPDVIALGQELVIPETPAPSPEATPSPAPSP